ncbi:hypothetical protein A0J57_04025 [Sphingobium sp. 22B]|uniref:class I adenylate-forming enzyme family protein n=1 Tax=unclassified Sphingobium TaxID=2611147 RepID=UPI0007856DA3|nr:MULTISPECIES: AMP-binding protein [unclassified Sphingobium]KXU33817.1 hypothetical protein AXW74_00575 [Sphingobium sp. AM]KYC33761.1 hypothetical protein A0J57_04025 [Sphingobium sp. 22B]OAP33499.1 hypothetical protein A8O16_03245 [Sphingobium sp. 20006FA]
MSEGSVGVVAASNQAYWPAQPDGEIVDWSVGDLLRHVAASVPEEVALLEPRDPESGAQRQWTYAQLLAESERVAHFLLRHFQPKDHVAIWAENRPEWIFVQLGAALAGMTLVAINPASRANELHHALSLSKSSGLFLSRHYRGTDTLALLEGIRGDLPLLRHVWLFDAWQDFDWPEEAGDLPAVSADDTAMIQFTSGTTGKAKAAMLSHRGVVNIAQFTNARFTMPTGSRWLSWLPLFHTGGCIFAILSCIWNRGTMVLLSGFDPAIVMRVCQEERPRWLPLVPTTALALLDAPDRSAYDLSSLEMVTQGGTPIAPELVRRLESELGVDHVMVFGQTETCSTVCLGVRGESDHHKFSTIGKAMPHTELRIVDPASGEIVPFGEVGEVQIRNFAVMQGYFGQPDATASTVDGDGWLHTGDLGTLQADGYMTLTGRLKDLIIRGGENIYPREIEDILATHPGIVEAAVFGAPDARWGERIVAALRMRPGETTTAADLKAFLAPLLARHKIPEAVWIVDAFPMTTSGKIQKFALRDAYLKTVAAS